MEVRNETNLDALNLMEAPSEGEDADSDDEWPFSYLKASSKHRELIHTKSVSKHIILCVDPNMTHYYYNEK